VSNFFPELSKLERLCVSSIRLLLNVKTLSCIYSSKLSFFAVSKGKLSSLLGLVIIDEGKKFCNIDTWVLPKGSNGGYLKKGD
jgi:hypothetical protein